MKKALLAIFLVLFSSYSFSQTNQNLENDIRVIDIINRIKAEVGITWLADTRDRIIIGDSNTKITGIATTFMATMTVLKKAKAANCNFIITHEPTFYSHYDDLTIHQNDPIQIEKIKFIKENNMVVWRFHDHQHRMQSGDQIYKGVVEKMNLKNAVYDNKTTISITQTTLNNLVKQLKNNLKANTIRVVGIPNLLISKIGLALGAAGTNTHFKVMESTDIELLIVGESNEWETVPYVQDAIEMGKKRALIVLGHADSEESGMIKNKDWLKGFYPNLKIIFIKAGNPYWPAY
jgi:putative NIF3 family GTP cyclohydrolase 1 type 2